MILKSLDKNLNRRFDNGLDSIKEAIEAIKNGEVIIVVDDESRENEGDFICAAQKITPEIVNFMTKEGRGLICVPLSEERCQDLNLNLMVHDNTSLHQTPFTVSVDLIGNECTTGISANDRSKTIKALADSKTSKEDLGRPGHIFPLKAKKGGVLRRTGHTEAALDLSKLAALFPAGVLVEIMNEDGTMARLPDLKKVAHKFNLKLISINDLINYRLQKETLIERLEEVSMPTKYGNFRLISYLQTNSNEIHLALLKGKWKKDEPVLVRVHSSCITGDIFGSYRCDCGEQLSTAMQKVEKNGKGVILYMNQEGRGIGLLSKLKSYKLQEKGLDTAEANLELGYKIDERDYGIGAQILRDLNICKIKLMTNNPKKRAGLAGYGLEIVENISIEAKTNPYNEKYLQTKRDKMGHDILATLVE